MSAGALDGIRVLDLTRYIPGPYCTMMLGDLGADVIKVEEPGAGDPTRAVPPEAGSDSATHAALNRNKRSIAVDLRRDEGAAVVRRLAARADVLVETFRPGVLAGRGLDADALRGDNPRLVYCSLSGYGQDGPLRARAGHDIDYAALGGFLGGNRDPEGRPALPSAQVADVTGALLGVIGVLAALQARERTGRGQVVDVSMFEAVLALMAIPLTRLMAGGTLGSELSGAYACYNVYRCRDGQWLAVGALESKFWARLCEALGRPELAGRQWSGGERQREALDALADLFARRDRDEWIRELAPADACVEPILDPAEVVRQGQARRSILEGRAGGSPFRTVGCPVRLSDTPASVRREPPALGLHGREVLGEAGFSDAEVEAMKRSGVVG